MPIPLHLFLMLVSLVGGFVLVAWYTWECRTELIAAGVPSWIVLVAAPILWPLTVVLVSTLLPARCPGCGWPIAFLRPMRKWFYRCLHCRHVHCTAWGEAPRTIHASYRRRVVLARLPIEESRQPHVRRVTFSGDVYRPCTLVLSLRPAPPDDAVAKVQTHIEAGVAHESGEVFVQAAGPLNQWNAERAYRPWRADLELRHPDWENVRVPVFQGPFALEVRIGEGVEALRSLDVEQMTIALEFRYGA